jgi:hypothetical protein
LEDQKRNFLVVDLVERKGGKPKQTVSVKCTKIVGFWQRNLSAPEEAGRKRPTAQLQNTRRSKTAMLAYDFAGQTERCWLLAWEWRSP